MFHALRVTGDMSATRSTGPSRSGHRHVITTRSIQSTIFLAVKMTLVPSLLLLLTAGISGATAITPIAHAEDSVTYEVVSDDVAVATVEYFDHSERKALRDVPLPWQTSVSVINARSASPDGAEVRADWRPHSCDGRGWCPQALPNKWVTVRIYYQGKVLCQSTLDVGDATCYGSTTFYS